jgi:hypothetical protein
MNERLETTIRIDSWDEQPTQEFDDGTKVAHAVVRLTDGNDGIRTGHMESVLYYRADGTSSYVSLIRLEGELGGKSGAFTALGEGAYDGTTAGGSLRIVGGTGDLEGISGTVGGDSTHDDYPNMPLVIEYDLG